MSRRHVPDFVGRLYTDDEPQGYAGTWVRRAEVDVLLDEIDRLNKKCAALALLHYGQPSAFEQASPQAYVEGLSENDNADCPACNIGNPGVYVKNGRMVCPHRPE